MSVSLYACTVASSIYMDFLSHYARHFCSSYQKQYRLALPFREFYTHTHTHTRARARARARTHTLFLLSLIFLSLALFWQISGKSARRRSKFWWIYGISNSYWHKRISLLSGQTNKGRPCRGRVVSFCGVKRGR